MSIVLQAEAIARRAAGGEPLLDVASLAIAAGDRIAIDGPSGSGKTLLLRALALLDPLDGGRILWRGRAVTDDLVPTFRRHVVYLHQTPALHEGSVEENLRLPFELRVYREMSFDRTRVLELLGAFGRGTEMLIQAVSDLSGGERQIVALVRALQLDPDLLLLDEPSASLDGEAAEALGELLGHWADGAGRAWAWVSHDPGRASAAATRRLRVAAQGRLTEI